MQLLIPLDMTQSSLPDLASMGGCRLYGGPSEECSTRIAALSSKVNMVWGRASTNRTFNAEGGRTPFLLDWPCLGVLLGVQSLGLLFRLKIIFSPVQII